MKETTAVAGTTVVVLLGALAVRLYMWLRPYSQPVRLVRAPSRLTVD